MSMNIAEHETPNPNIDFCFIGDILNNNDTVGAIKTTSETGKRGVTIAMGLDLGRTTETQLRKMALNPTLVGKLYPYLQKTGEQAKDYLAMHELRLSKAEINAINLGIHQAWVNELVKQFNSESSTVFQQIAPYWQTVIAAVAMQYKDIRKQFPAFWMLVVSQRWTEALDLLQDNTAKHAHQQEAAYLIRWQSE